MRPSPPAELASVPGAGAGATAPASWPSEAAGAAETKLLSDAEEARVARITDELDGIRIVEDCEGV